MQDINLGFNSSHSVSRDFISARLINPGDTSSVIIYSVVRGESETRIAESDYDVFLDSLASFNPYNRNYDATQPFYDFSATPINLNDSSAINPLSVFDGESSQGIWTLEVCNTSPTDSATYNRSVLELSDTDPIVNDPTTSRNLDYTVGCEVGTKIAIVLDASGSVNESEAQLTREAIQALIEEFIDTGTQIGMVEYARIAKLQVDFAEVTSSSVTNTFAPYLNNTFPDRSTVGNFTNWEAGLQTTFDELRDADAVIFVTDGNPNTYSNENISSTFLSQNLNFTPIIDADNGFVPVNEAIRPSNLIKANGTHIYAFGITEGVDIETLRQVAEGTNSIQFDGANAITADFEFLSNFTTDVLAKSLTNFAQGLCDSNRPRLRLAKRITAINPGQPGNEQIFNSFVDDTTTTDDNYPYWPDNDNTFLPGQINVPNIQPGDEVEYTIYFLSSGGIDAQQVKFCDAIPDNMTFVSNAYGGLSGMALGLDSSSPATTVTSLSNTADTDGGEFFLPNSNPPPDLCKKVVSNNNVSTVVDLNMANNLNGAVVVDLDLLPKASSPGTPANSYGFVRFRAKVK